MVGEFMAYDGCENDTWCANCAFPMAHLDNSYNLRSHWDDEDSFQMEEN
jgi:hypothetical protein